MQPLLHTLASLRDLLLVVLGFGFIIFVHELGHFLAARWAGIRVLAFALGFGPAAVSYRKGLGWRRGSSDAEYEALRRGEREGLQPVDPHAVSPTEYRLNWLPFGGYVKMLGQEDLDPTAVSAAPDSYQRCPPWKRMVVISAGVVMNVITAAVLFIGVFMHGLKTEPAVIGDVAPGLPASQAVARNAGVAGVTEPGLKPSDEVVAINGHPANSFNDIALASAMAGRGRSIEMTVRRPGVAMPLEFVILPKAGKQSKLLEIGVGPARSATLFGTTPEHRDEANEALRSMGLAGVEPGMRLVAAGDLRDVRSGHALVEAARRSGGAPIDLEFRGGEGGAARSVHATLLPEPELQTGTPGTGAEPGPMPVNHLLGLVPLMRVQAPTDAAREQGLEEGDVLVKVGAREFPRADQGVAEIRSRKGDTVAISVLRKGPAGAWTRTELKPVKVDGEGRIGFVVGDASAESTTVAPPPDRMTRQGDNGTFTPAAYNVITRAGTTIRAVAGTPVNNFRELRGALRDATAAAAASKSPTATVRLTLEHPLPAEPGAAPPTETVDWTLTAPDVQALHALGWESPIYPGAIFEPEQIVLRATEGPVQAIRMGLSETKRVMLTTYLTFARLFDGTVRVEHLKGPVGIAHLGTQIAERGYTWLFFFMALVSVNLAVINFLPLPIVDGGQFIFLVVEQIRGRPVPVQIQNAATVAGLAVIGTIFLITTYNDIFRLFKG
jgi:regulator of sigma E protease